MIAERAEGGFGGQGRNPQEVLLRSGQAVPILNLVASKEALKGAQTGQSLRLEAFRATNAPAYAPSAERGTFFAPEATAEYGDHIYGASLVFDNPLVVADGAEAAKFLKRPALARIYEHLLSGMSAGGEAPLTGRDVDPFAKADNRLAEHARAAGYDGVIFKEHDDLNPVQYMVLKPEAVQSVRPLGTFNFKTGMVEPPKR